MIKEQYVGFDTAKMLKEAGFDVPGTSQYTEGMGVWNVEYPYNFNADDLGYSRPTQALAARWILETHSIFIEDYILVNGMFSYRLFRNGRNLVSEQSDMYESLQECIEDSLQEALRLIIKNKDNEQTNN